MMGSLGRSVFMIMNNSGIKTMVIGLGKYYISYNPGFNGFKL